MSRATIEKNLFLEGFEPLLKSREGEPAFVTALRHQAFIQFVEVGIPNRRLERWLHTDLTSLARTPFVLASAPHAKTLSTLDPLLLAGTRELVFIDGRFAPEFSHCGMLGAGAHLGSLDRALTDHPDLVEAHLGHCAGFDQAFTALNTAYWQDGAFIYLETGTVVPEPIHLVFLTTGGTGEPTVSYPRTLVVAGANSQATIIETYASLEAGVHFTCPVTEIVCLDNAVIDHYRLERENPASYHLATTHARLERDAQLTSFTFTVGGALVRNDLYAELAAPGSGCTLNGLYLADGTQHIDNHLWVRHIAPRASSRQIYKGILSGQARAVFNGNIHVHPEAQKTDAKQTNRNLLLSNKAIVHTNPQLEIFAGDVKCTHGSTVGQLDEDALFYLRSRGLGTREATSLLTYAFASDLFESVRPDALRQSLEKLLFTWLSSGAETTEANR